MSDLTQEDYMVEEIISQDETIKKLKKDITTQAKDLLAGIGTNTPRTIMEKVGNNLLEIAQNKEL